MNNTSLTPYTTAADVQNSTQGWLESLDDDGFLVMTLEKVVPALLALPHHFKLLAPRATFLTRSKNRVSLDLNFVSWPLPFFEWKLKSVEELVTYIVAKSPCSWFQVQYHENLATKLDSVVQIIDVYAKAGVTGPGLRRNHVTRSMDSHVMEMWSLFSYDFCFSFYQNSLSSLSEAWQRPAILNETFLGTRLMWELLIARNPRSQERNVKEVLTYIEHQWTPHV